jgi:hypothetical protein
MDDPQAWAGSIAFEGKAHPAAVTAHVKWCIKEIPGFPDKVPVKWSFGRIYWEKIADLQLV